MLTDSGAGRRTINFSERRAVALALSLDTVPSQSPWPILHPPWEGSAANSRLKHESQLPCCSSVLSCKVSRQSAAHPHETHLMVTRIALANETHAGPSRFSACVFQGPSPSLLIFSSGRACPLWVIKASAYWRGTASASR